MYTSTKSRLLSRAIPHGKYEESATIVRLIAEERRLHEQGRKHEAAVKRQAWMELDAQCKAREGVA